MRTTIALLICGLGLLASEGCSKNHGSLLVVHVTAAQPVNNIASLAVKITAAGRDKNVTLPITTGTIPPEQTFGIEFGSDVTGSAFVQVDARDSTTAILITGSATGNITVGGTTDLTVTLGVTQMQTDMGDDGGDAGDDLAEPDMTLIICDPRGITPPACVWRWQTPLPVGEDIVSVHSFADNDTFAMTKSGTILHRDGTGWSVLPARPKAAIGTFVPRRMAGGTGGVTDLFITGFVNQSSNDIWEVFHSADKGATWTEEALPATATVFNDTFFGMAVGVSGDVILAGDFSHIVTRNHSTGAWTDYQTDATCAPPSMGCSTNYKAITSSVLANVSTTATKLSRANVGTNTWTTFAAPGSGTLLNALCNGPGSGINERYWGVGYSGAIGASTDSSTWALQTSSTAALLNGCVAISDTTAWAFGASGTIVATTNGGVAGAGTWGGQTSGTSNQLLSGSHSPASSLTIGGVDGVILRSMNGGTSYTNEQTGPSGGWDAIYGASPKAVWAVGNTGSIVRTTDGLTWQPVTASGTTNNLIAAWGSSASDVYAVGLSGTVVHATDGTNFTKYANPGSGGIPATSTLVDIAGLAANNVFIAADTGLYRSTDNGASWAPVTVTGFTGPQVHSVFAMGGGLWIGGESGQIYYTTDGTTWASQTLTGIGMSLPISKIRGRLPNELYAASNAGGWLAHTSNGGTTWTNGVVMSLGAGAYDLAVTPSGNVYATGNALLISQDGGMNFVPVNTAPVPSAQIALYAPSDSEIFATGSGGVSHFGN